MKHCAREYSDNLRIRYFEFGTRDDGHTAPLPERVAAVLDAPTPGRSAGLA